MKRLRTYRWAPKFRWELFLRKIMSQQEKVLGYELVFFCWEIQWYKHGVL